MVLSSILFAGLKDVDYTKYPSKELQWDWLKTYLKEFHSDESNSTEICDLEIEKLFVVTNKFALASHLFWGIWALIQAEHSYIDFDFMK